MSWWDPDVTRLTKLVKRKVEELESYFAAKKPAPEPPRSAPSAPPPRGESQSHARETPRPPQPPPPRGRDIMERALALHRAELSTEGAAAEVAALQHQLAASHGLDAQLVLTAGLVAAFEGQAAEARSLLQLVDGFDRQNDALASAHALAWLSADAAARGDWSLALRHGNAAHKDGSGQVAFFAALAAWHLRLPEGRLDPLSLQVLADGMPNVADARALATAATNQGGPVSRPLTHDDGLLGRAVAAHATLRGTPVARLRTQDVLELAELWDGVLGSRGVAASIAGRRSALGATTSVEATLEGLRSTVQRDLGEKLLDSDLALSGVADGARAGVLGGVIEGLEERLAAELDIGVVALGERRGARRDLTLLGECHHWLALRRQVERLDRLCGASGRLVAFGTVYPAVAEWSIDLWNRRSARSLPNAMFGWIAAIAQDAAASSVAETFRKNREW